MNFLSGLTGSNVNKKNVENTEGMMAAPMMGGRRRKSRRASRKMAKKSRKMRKTSKKSKKSRKSRRGNCRH